MLLDQQNTLSDRQAITALGTVRSTNVIDLGVNDAMPNGAGSYTPDFTKANPELRLLVQVTETFTSAGAATLAAELVTADDAAITTNVTTHHTTSAQALAALKAGTKIPVPLPSGIKQRYLALRYTVGTAAMTAGSVYAGFTLDR